MLTDPEKRKAYDAWKNSGIEIPFEKWQALRESTKTVRPTIFMFIKA